MTLSSRPWLMRRGEIAALTRDYVLAVLSHPRDDRGRPVFSEEEEAARGWAARRAEAMGLPRGRAREFAGERGGAS